ncbi:MAG: hypothetical protein V7643_1296 [Mycobacterium sp.]|jgi:hypothetical protein
MDELSDIVTADATALAAAIRGKQLSSVEVVNAQTDRQE